MYRSDISKVQNFLDNYGTNEVCKSFEYILKFTNLMMYYCIADCFQIVIEEGNTNEYNSYKDMVDCTTMVQEVREYAELLGEEELKEIFNEVKQTL